MPWESVVPLAPLPVRFALTLGFTGSVAAVVGAVIVTAWARRVLARGRARVDIRTRGRHRHNRARRHIFCNMEYRELIDVGFHGVDIDGRAGGAFIGFGGYRRHFEQRRIGFHGDAVPGGGHGARQIHGQLNIGARLGGVRARHCDTGYRLA